MELKTILLNWSKAVSSSPISKFEGDNDSGVEPHIHLLVNLLREPNGGNLCNNVTGYTLGLGLCPVECGVNHAMSLAGAVLDIAEPYAEELGLVEEFKYVRTALADAQGELNGITQTLH
jgi:hypothetical protein